MPDYLIIRKEDVQMIRRILDSAEAAQKQAADSIATPPQTFQPLKPPMVATLIVPPKPAIPRPAASGFVFGAASEAEMVGVNKDLVTCNRLALSISTQDYCVYDGIRSYKEQQQHVANGTSQTMESKHLKGLAIDNVPWIGGQPVWDWDGCYKIALAMDEAATKLGIAHRITWGGAWDKKLSDFGGSPEAYKKAVDDYVARHPGKDFIDGPHYEILP